MSFENYEKALKIIGENKNIMDCVGERSNELVLKAEKALGLKLPRQYKDFVLRFGAGDFGAVEFYGLIDDDFENSGIPDVVWVTLNNRKKFNFPKHLLIIYYTGFEELFCLDFNNLNRNNEPRVVSFAISADIEHQTYEIIADDFGDFLLDSIEQELEFIKEEEEESMK